jgi:GTPase SAR1 family protein
MKLQLWDTGGMERVASITSSYYKYSEAAILVFALDRPDTFHVLAQHLLVSFKTLQTLDRNLSLIHLHHLEI